MDGHRFREYLGVAVNGASIEIESFVDFGDSIEIGSVVLTFLDLKEDSFADESTKELEVKSGLKRLLLRLRARFLKGSNLLFLIKMLKILKGKC